jgi:salicylate 5-hydroxylase large subunit
VNAPDELRGGVMGASRWGPEPTSRVPGWVYTDPDIFEKELQRFFYRSHWCYVGLECEIPQAGNFKRTVVGERSVIMVRDHDGEVRVVENRCAHRGVAFCRERHGTVKDFICPYHQWNYGPGGQPDRPAVPAGRETRRQGAGGHAAGFRPGGSRAQPIAGRPPRRRGLRQLRPRRGAFRRVRGPEVLHYFDRVFGHRPLQLLGYNRQRIPANWKLMQENIKDPYHPGLLHTWFVTFGLWRADQRSEMVMDLRHRHASMVSRRNEGGAGDVTRGVSSFRESMKLNDERLLDVVPEDWWQGPTVVMTTLFPSVIIQQQVNSLSTRHLQPVAPGVFDFVWTHFGFADDSAEMTRRRLRQANLFGPAGFVSADDGEIIEFAQQAFQGNSQARTVSELDGRDVRPTDHMVTETLIRGMYGYWREVMEL